MVGTYKLGGKTVSETKFKESVYGKDSKQALASKRKDVKEQADVSSAGSKGSSFHKSTSKDGTVEVVRTSTGEVVSSKTVEQLEAERLAKRKTVVVGVGEVSAGNRRVEDVGAYLTEEQRKQVSRLTSEKGRLSVQDLQESRSVNEQGDTVISRSVTFAYKEPVISDPELKQFIKGDSQDIVHPYAPVPSGAPFQTTSEDMGSEVDLSGVFSLEETREPSVVSATPFIDERSDYQKIKADIKHKLFSQEDTEPLTVKEIVYSVPVGVAGAVVVAGGLAKGFFVGGVYHTARAFTVDIDQTLQGTTDLVTGKTRVSDVTLAMSESLHHDPAYFAGQTIFVVAGGKIASKGFGKAKDLYVRAGSTFVEPEIIFAETVLTGAEKLPKSGSTAESLARFAKADDVVVTSSPAKLKGEEAGLGRKGAVGIEDTGIYVSPAGEGSPYFLRLGDDFADYSFLSLDPLGNVRSAFEVPTVTRAQTTGVVQYPRSVVKEAGFQAVKEFQEAQAGSGKAFITKRSELGQGDISRQTFVATEDFVEGSFNIKKGDILREAGTSEIEAVIPYKQEFAYTPETSIGKVKGFDYYTTFEGRNVAVRDTILLTDDGSAVIGLVDDAGRQTKILSGEQVATEASYVYGGGSSKSVTSPYSLLSGVSRVSHGNAVIKSGSLIPRDSVALSSQVSSVSYVVKTKTFSSSEVISQPSSIVSPISNVSGRSKRSSKYSVVVSKPVSVVSQVSQPSSIVSSSVSGSSGISGGSGGSGYGSGVISYIHRPPKPVYFSSSRQKPDRGGFDVFVRERGVFKKVTSNSLSKFDARDLGAYTVHHTPRATFTLRPSSFPLGKVSSGVRGSFFAFRSNFRKKGGLFIEKRGKRIQTGGEKAGITRLGLLAIKHKRKFKGLKI